MEILKGTVRDMDNGTPLEDVIVWIKDKGSDFKTKTKNGIYKFHIEGNQGDKINIDFDKDGYTLCDDNDKIQRLGEERDVLLCK